MSNENGPVTDTLASPAVSMCPCCTWNRTTRPKPFFPIPVSHEGSKAGNKRSPIQACFLSLVPPKSSLTLALRPPALGERTRSCHANGASQTEMTILWAAVTTDRSPGTRGSLSCPRGQKDRNERREEV